MNWTGGRLSRHSTAASSLKNRQKQHFARVQATLRNGTKKPSPLKRSDYDRVEDRGSSHPQRSETSRSYHREESQPIQRHRLPPLPNTHTAPHDNSRYITGSLEPPHTRQPPPQYIKREFSTVPEDDLYNTTPPPPGTKRNRENSIPIPEMDCVMDQQDEESVFEKRRRILRKSDWVGINIQRPLQLAFTSPKNNDKVGKRRKITDDHRARYRTKQSLIISPFLARSRRHPIAHPDNERHQDKGYGRSDVRISIGGRHVQPGISSSSRPSKFRDNSVHSHGSNLPRAESSEVMLLDDEEKLARLSSRIERRCTSFRNVEMPVFEVDSNEYDNNSRITDEDLEEGGAQQLYGPSGIQGTLYGWDGEYLEAGEEPKDDDQVDKEENIRDSRPGLHIPKVSTLGRNDGLKSKRLIVSSSEAPIQQPIPQSSKMFRLLSSGSSEIADSTATQVGRVKPVVPSSQLLDNEIWQTWMAPFYDENGQGSGYVDEDNGFMEEVSISPGLSAAAAFVHSRRRLPSERGEECSVLETTDSSDGERHGSTQAIMTQTSIDHGTHLEDTKDIREGDILDRTDKTGTGVYELMPNNLHTKAKETRTSMIASAHEKPAELDDTDEIWRRFVFGSWSNDDDELDQNSKATQIQKSVAGFSIIAHPPTIGSSSAKCSGPRKSFTSESYYTKAIHDLAPEFGTTEAASKCWEPHESLSTSDPATADEHVSMHTSKSSHFTSNSGSGPASMDAQASSKSLKIVSAETSSSPWPQKRVIFTKPNPFVRVKADFTSSNGRGEVVHIGRRLLAGKEDAGSKKKERDEYSLVGSDEMDELESIEDE